jgi:spermidine dehydrogenase
MNDERKDRELGMAREITRRDFLNGVAVGAGASVLGAGFSAECLLAAAILDEPAGEQAEEYYPPAKMGLRGDNDGSYTYAHKLRDGESPNARGEPVDTG